MLKFETTDTKATSGIRWKTVGFTVTRERCLSGEKANGGYPVKLKHATLWLKEEYKKEETGLGGIVNVTFTIPEKVVTDALFKAGMGNIQDNDILYLHGIFQVTHSGKDYGSKKYDLPTIMKAEGWANPNDFRDRFDVEVEYYGTKAPVIVQYRTQSGEIISTEELPEDKWVSPGQKATVTFESKKTFKGKTYTLGHSYYRMLNSLGVKRELIYVKEAGMAAVQTRSAKQQLMGVRFVAIMYKDKTSEILDEIEGEYLEPTIEGVIGADTRGNEAFDVEQGIPSGEKVYGNMRATNYLLRYQFKQKKGIKNYHIKVNKTYYLSWYDSDGFLQTSSETVRENYVVEREYSYWEIKELSVYGLHKSSIKNKIFSSGSITLPAEGVDIPEISYTHSASVSEHIEDPEYSDIYLYESIDGYFVPSENFQSIANNAVGQIKVKNDKLVFNGQIIMDDNQVQKETSEPKEIPGDTELCSKDVMFSPHHSIPKEQANQEYGSTGTVTYKRIVDVNSSLEEELVFETDEINSVVIHTPIVCDAQVQNKKDYNQMIYPDKSKASLILDMTFNIQFLKEGYHRNIKGYGYQDYSKYAKKRQVQFPFDVYQGTTFIPRNTWYDFEGDTQEYYLPVWVDEGQYAIKYRTISINAEANNGMENEEDLANLNISNYVAIDYTDIEVSGRIYSMNLYDISDYPLWETVFRKKNSMELTETRYTVGTKTQNGVSTSRDEMYTLPLLNGSHPTYKNQGALKTGYVFRYRVTTVGNMYGDNDYIRIKPKFYYVDKKGKNRQEVDIYYTETFQNKKNVMVKIGSELDKTNRKRLRTGDAWLTIPKTELKTTANIQGVPLKNWNAETHYIYTFDNIMIPKYLRTYFGSADVPSVVNTSKAIVSKQHWYGEYYLPAEIHVAPKGFDVADYANKQYGLDYKESFWLKDGYVIVNFDIETIKNGNRYLSYINEENAKDGYCNMWENEGFSYQKTDWKGNTFQLKDGDVIFYDTNWSVSNDYISGGTH